MTEDHKVVGMQYVVGSLLFLFTGGLFAMMIRTGCSSPTTHAFGPGTYIEIVWEHGTIMMMMASSSSSGPSATGLVPLMIGCSGWRIPRVEAPRSGSSWLATSSSCQRRSSRRVPDRLDRLRAAADPGRRQAMDAYLVGVRASSGLAMILAGFNLA